MFAPHQLVPDRAGQVRLAATWKPEDQQVFSAIDPLAVAQRAVHPRDRRRQLLALQRRVRLLSRQLGLLEVPLDAATLPLGDLHLAQMHQVLFVAPALADRAGADSLGVVKDRRQLQRAQHHRQRGALSYRSCVAHVPTASMSWSYAARSGLIGVINGAAGIRR